MGTLSLKDQALYRDRFKTYKVFVAEDGEDLLDQDTEEFRRYAPFFSNIRALGKQKIATYQALAANAHKEPWKLQTCRRAQRVSETARMGKADGLNEMSWRLRLEGLIMARFSVEVSWYDARYLASQRVFS